MNGHHQYVAIITDDPGWHGRELKAALFDQGLHSRYLSLSDCQIRLDGSDKDLSLAGIQQLPIGVFVRGVSGGTLEQIIFRLDILHALHDMGITVFNTARAIERTVDKALTSLLLQRSALPVPSTWVCESREQAESILDNELSQGNRVVSKPLFGSQGIGLYLIDSRHGLVHDEACSGIYYLQRYIEKTNDKFSDIRVFVVNKKAIAAMLRCSQHWLTNRAQGADCQPMPLNNHIAMLAEKACEVLGVDYAGVDLMQDRHNQHYIIEVNSIPAWYGLQKVVDFNIARCLIQAFVQRIAEHGRLKYPVKQDGS